MNASFTLILVVAGAYLAAHVAFGWLARRFLIVSGAEYLLLGVLLGPQVSRLISASVFDGFAPFMTLALGWIGTLVGAQFYLPEMMRFGTRAYRVAFAEALFTMGAVGGVLLLTFWQVLSVPLGAAVAPAVVIGAVAAASSPAGIGIIARKLRRPQAVVQQLQITTAIDALVAITAFGLVLVLNHAPPDGPVRPPTPTEWAVISLGIGCVGGALFHLFLGRERNVDRLFIGLAGAIILASGAAAYLRLSPLLPTMLIGAILVNTSGNRVQIRQAMSSVERPIYFVLLIFAGAAWQPSGRTWIVPVLVFLLARTAMKIWGARMASWLNDATPVLGPRWGYALLGQGGLAVAIGLNYLLHDRSVLANVVFTAALISVLLTDITSARLAERVVRATPRPGRWRSPLAPVARSGEGG